MKQTQVICLYGGPGTGKSTISAEIFYRLKLQYKKVELVREFIKDWAYQNRAVGQYDQIYISGNQAFRESNLYGIAEYLVTDCPLLLGPFYQEYYSGVDIVGDSIFKFLEYAEKQGVVYRNFFIERSKNYDPVGRYETESEARLIDEAMRNWLDNKDVSYQIISGPLSNIGNIILSLL